ncbi:MAG: class I tRNA ligase family protein, partial [Peptoniphilus sp.]
MSKNFYVTTPIYYPSDNLHIGHTYCTVAADAIKRFKTLQGYNVLFTTGTDEHGQKIQEKAKEAGKEPLEYIDAIVADTKKLWKTMDIHYDSFVRSTDPVHEKNVQALFQKLYDKGEIYKGEYEGYYCTPCESFWAESQLGEGHLCPDCGRETHLQHEESYFFRLSKYRDKLLQYYEDHPEFIQPAYRKSEMINSFLKDGLDDLSVTRSTFDWGVPVPFDDKHVIYVWIDALSCYLTGAGLGTDDDQFNGFWPADVHLVGKEIMR